MRETQSQRGHIDGHSFYENGHIHHLKKETPTLNIGSQCQSRAFDWASMRLALDFLNLRCFEDNLQDSRRFQFEGQTLSHEG